MVPPSFVDHGPKLRLLKVTKSGPEAKKRPTERPNGRLPENRSYPSGYGGLTIPLSWFFGRKSIFCSHPPISLLPLWLNTKTTTFSCCSCCWASTRGGGCKSQKDLIFMISIVLPGIVGYCMELLCMLWYRIVSMFYRMVLHGIVLYLMVLHCWLRRAGCISQDTYTYFICNNPCSKKVSRPWCSIVGDKKDDKSES